VVKQSKKTLESYTILGLLNPEDENNMILKWLVTIYQSAGPNIPEDFSVQIINCKEI